MNKNLIFLIPSINNSGGISRVVSSITDGLVGRYNYKIHLVGFNPGEISGYNWNLNIEYNTINNQKTSVSKGFLSSTMFLKKYIKDKDIDVLVACGSLMGPLGVFSTLFSKTKLIYWDHSNFFENTSHKFKIECKKFTSMFSDIVVALTKIDKVNYINNTKAKRVVQIYNPLDPHLFYDDNDYDSTSSLIVSVGRLTNQKDFETLVEVANIVKNSTNEFEWHIYGEGQNRSSIENKISSYSLSDKVILMGQSANLYQIYNKYSMMVMTSKYEGFPMVLLEGLANKLPLISFDIETGPNEIIEENINGFLISDRNINQMADKIITLLKDKSKRLSFSSFQKSKFKDFNYENVLKKWDKLLKE